MRPVATGTRQQLRGVNFVMGIAISLFKFTIIDRLGPDSFHSGLAWIIFGASDNSAIQPFAAGQ
ncbi:MAG: hypothetical protein ACNA7E_10200 [Wenzhouxiangellaceae bacterium]